jgi:hypothetical protein
MYAHRCIARFGPESRPKVLYTKDLGGAAPSRKKVWAGMRGGRVA